MKDITELERIGLKEQFDLEENEIFEAKNNLLGFFNVLYKIDQRLKKEKSDAEEGKRNAR